MSLLQTIEQDAQNAEAWVVAEIQKGWTALQNAEQTLVVDVNGVLTWLKNNQAQIQAVFTTFLNEVLPLAGAVDPQIAPLIPVTTTALDAAEAAIDTLSQSVVDGTTPMSTVSSGYQIYKNAEAAVNTVLKAQAGQPASVSATTAATVVSTTAPTTQAPAASS